MTNWRTDIVYGADGSVTTTAPQLPVAWKRPAPQWQFFTPAMPNAYE